MKMRVFLTGASGYLGSLLAERIAQMPEVENVTGMASTAPTAPLPAKVKFVRMDIRSPDLAAAIAGHDVVVHTACVVLWSAKMRASERDDINLNGVRNVAQAALAHKVRRFVHASSMAAYDPALAQGKTGVTEDFPLGKGDSPYYYWNAKASAERSLTELFAGSSTLLSMFRPIYIIGPRNRPTTERYRENSIKFPGRDPRRQFVHEEDVAAAFVQALRSEMPGAFNVVPDDFIRLSDVWKIVGARSIPTVPAWVARLVTWLKWRYFGSPVHSSWVADMLVDFTGSNAKLKQAGWKPRYGSAEALRSAL
jgi:nucleoside-diphosphate-sugar epimerase